MRIALLGHFRILADDATVCELIGEKPRILLTCLALRARRHIEVEQLKDALWGSSPPASVTSNLQTYTSRIRRVLDQATPGGADRLSYRSGRYRLDLDDGECDVLDLQRLCAAGQAAVKRRDLREAGRLCTLATQLPLGPVFSAHAQARCLRLTGESRRVEEMWITAYEIRAQTALRDGCGVELLADLRRLVADFPLRERLHELLVRALCQSGDVGSALVAYQDARDVLADELGVEPGPHLRRLHQALLHTTLHGLDLDDPDLQLHGKADDHDGRRSAGSFPSAGPWFFVRGIDVLPRRAPATAPRSALREDIR
jgi:DNA-binding SARP family transcriptional activator